MKTEYLNIDLIKALMIVKGINDKDLAECMAISISTVKRLFKSDNHANMRIDIVPKLSKALKVPILILFNKEYQ